MTFAVVSNSSTGMCFTIENMTTRLFCNDEVKRGIPLYAPTFFTMKDLVERDFHTALTAKDFEGYSARCTNLIKKIACANVIRPCSIINPPTDSGICSSTCDFLKQKCGRKYYTLCDFDSFIKNNKSDEAICAAPLSDSSSKMHLGLITFVGLQVIGILAQVF